MSDESRGATFAAGLLVGFAVLLRLRPLESLDLWWHLSMGRLVRATGSRTFEDPHSWDVGHAYTDPEWLYDLGALAVWEAGGVAATIVATALLAGASAFLAWRVAAALLGPDRPWAAVLLATLAVGGSSWRFDPRPQSAFLVLLPLTMLAAARARGSAGRGRRAWLAVLVCTLVVWSQSHSSMVIGPCVAWALCLPRGRADAPWSGPQLGLLVLLGAVPLLGPFGLGVIDQVLGHSGSDAARHITDMRPMPLSGWWPLPGGSVLYVELLAVLGLGGMVAHRRIVPGPLLLLLLGLAMTLTAHRFRAAWALMAIPLAAEALRASAGWTEGRLGRRTAAAAAVTVPLLLSLGEPGPSLRWDERSVPVDATGAMAALGVEGRLLNDYDGGGWIGWAAGPDVQVFIDGRTPTHFSGARFAEARAAYADPTGAAFGDLHATHAFDAVLIRRDQGLCDALTADAAWDAAWFGETRALFVPAGSAGPGVAALAPCTSQSSVGRCLAGGGDATRAFAELDRLRALDPAHGYLDRLGVALALACAGDPQRAAEHLGEATRFDPSHPDLPRFAATIHLGLGRPADALRTLANTPPDDGDAIDLRLQALHALDRPEDALEPARARVAALDDAASADHRALLAWACAAAGDEACVLRESTRAALLGDAASVDRLVALRNAGRLPATHDGLLDALLAASP